MKMISTHLCLSPASTHRAVLGYPNSAITTRFLPRFSVTVDSTGNEYNLIIYNLQTDDAGTYRCIDDYGFGGHKHDDGIPGHEYRAEVTVIDGNFSCVQYINGTQVNQTKLMGMKKNDTMVINCSLKYIGRITPSLLWSVLYINSNLEALLYRPLPVTHAIQQGTHSVIMSTIEVNFTEIMDHSYIKCNLTDGDRYSSYAAASYSENSANVFWISETMYTKEMPEVPQDSPGNFYLTAVLIFILLTIIILLIISTILCKKRNLCSKKKQPLPLPAVNRLEYDCRENLVVTWSKTLANNKFEGLREVENFDDYTTLSNAKSSLGLPYIVEMSIYVRRWYDRDYLGDRDVIGGMKIKYSNGVTLTHGDFDKQPIHSFKLDSDERIIKVNCFAAWMVDGIQFMTNKGRSFGPYGGYDNNPRSIVGTNRSAYLACIRGKVMKTHGENAIRHLEFGWIHCNGYQKYLSKEHSFLVVKNAESIKGLIIMNEKLYTIHDGKSTVKVFHSDTMAHLQDIDIPDMKEPESLTGSAANNTLYISDQKTNGECIHRVRLTVNNVISWGLRKNCVPFSVSMTSNSNLLIMVRINSSDVECNVEARIMEYSCEGQFQRQITLDIKNSWQTLELRDDRFIMCYGEGVPFKHGICIINSEGIIVKNVDQLEANSDDTIRTPRSLALDVKHEIVFVADFLKSRILMFDYDLSYIGKINTEQTLSFPSRLYYDSNSDRLFIGEGWAGTRLLVINPSSS